MSDNNQEIYISKLTEYLAEIEKIWKPLEDNLIDKHSKAGKQEKTFFYRGENDSSYRLAPKLFRKGEDNKRLYDGNAEKALLEDLAAAYHDEFRQDKTAFERILRAQHYGLPTRFLDVTLNPLIALYFACQEKKDEEGKNKEGQVHIFCALNKYVLGAESDRLRIICNLAYLKYDDKKLIDEYSKDDKFFEKIKKVAVKLRASPDNLDREEQQFKQAAISYNHLLDELEKESGSYFCNIKRHHLRRAFFVRPLYSNARIRAQAGGFLFSAFSEKYTKIQESTVDKPAEKCADSKAHAKFLVKAVDKAKILKELDVLNINEMTVFPEMEHGAVYLAGKYLNKRSEKV